MQRLFMSAHGKHAAAPHMEPGDQFLPTLHRIRGARDGEIHVVGKLPSGVTATDLADRAFRIVWHDHPGRAGQCDVECAAAAPSGARR